MAFHDRTADQILESLQYFPDSESKLVEAREVLTNYSLTEVQLNFVRSFLDISIRKKVSIESGIFPSNPTKEISEVKNILKDGDFKELVTAVSQCKLTDAQYKSFLSCYMMVERLFKANTEIMEGATFFYSKKVTTVSVCLDELRESFNLIEKYDLSDKCARQLDYLFEYHGLVGLKELEECLLNFSKYQQHYKPFIIWIKEIMGVSEAKDHASNVINDKQEELHTEMPTSEQPE